MRLRFALTSGQWAISIISGLLIGGGVATTLFTPGAFPAAGSPQEGIATSISMPAPSPTPTLTTSPSVPPTLDDLWEGRALWQLEIADVGLPIGESDTLLGPDEQLWSYLHASYESAGIVDQWGDPVAFPGCVTLWKSTDAGRHFSLTAPQCLIPCEARPCTPEADQIDQQQYPRVARSESGVYVMVYEWGGATYLRTSEDGLNWSASARVPGTGQWYRSLSAPCGAVASVGPHPFVDDQEEYDCLIGAPPGLVVEGDQLYVFVDFGKNPGHMGCFTGEVEAGAEGLRPCAANPLFTGAATYGPVEATDARANPYFDFRITSAAEVLKVGERYYMMYEGVRGPTALGEGDVQFNLGLARSPGPQIDGPWEKYAGNPLLLDVPGNVGVGHADLIVLDGCTYLYTATSDHTRGRYQLVWKP
jgi:hypothetical protein